MERLISAADANRKFSAVLRNVRHGHSYVVTSHGRPVANIIPADSEDHTISGARAALLNRLERQDVVEVVQWSRDVVYDE